MRRKAALIVLIGGLAAIATTAALATATITYTYDAQGRLVQVLHTGSVNNNLTTTYGLDNADDRVIVNTTGSPNGP